jgi:hypothetical protein
VSNKNVDPSEQSRVIDDNALCPASPAETDIISFKNCGLKPSMPAADPQGNESMAFLTSISLTFKIWGLFHKNYNLQFNK